MTKEARRHQLWIDLAERVCQESRDRSTKVGCVIVSADNTILSTGWNDFPRGVIDDDESKHQRPAKYDWTEHAERNAIYNAARKGIALEGSTAYLNYTPWAVCTHCVRALIQVGVVRMVGPDRAFDGAGIGSAYDIDVINRQMFDESKMEVVVMERLGTRLNG